MNKYAHELPDNDVDYPMYMDSADMDALDKRNHRDMQELRLRLIEQVKQKGITNCGLTSIAEIDRIFWKYK